MKVVKLGKVDIDFDKLDKVIREYVPSGFNVHDGRVVKYSLSEMHCHRELKDTKRLVRSIGTLGGGRSSCLRAS